MRFASHAIIDLLLINPIEDNRLIKLHSDETGTEPILMLIDTGADISLIKINHLNDDIFVFPETKCQIKGITSQSNSTLGSCEVKLNFTNKQQIPHTFQTVPSDFPIQCAGILGKDFLMKDQCKLDYSNCTLEIPNLSDTQVINFISTHFIPPRMETIIQLPFDSTNNTECFCPAQEIVAGVFVANSLVKIQNNLVTFGIVNTTEECVDLRGSSIKMEHIKNYNIYHMNVSDDNINERLKNLENELNLSELNDEEKDKNFKNRKRIQ